MKTWRWIQNYCHNQFVSFLPAYSHCFFAKMNLKIIGNFLILFTSKGLISTLILDCAKGTLIIFDQFVLEMRHQKVIKWKRTCIGRGHWILQFFSRKIFCAQIRGIFNRATWVSQSRKNRGCLSLISNKYGKSIFGRIGSSKKATQKKSNYELWATFELGFFMFSWSEN